MSTAIRALAFDPDIARTPAPLPVRRLVLVPGPPVRREDAELELAFATVPRHREPERVEAGHLPGVRSARREDALALYRRGPAPAGPVRGAHPARRVERAKIGLAGLALAALLTALAVVLLGSLALARGGGIADGPGVAVTDSAGYAPAVPGFSPAGPAR